MKRPRVALLWVATCSPLLQACNVEMRPDTFEREAARVEETLKAPVGVKLVERSEARRSTSLVVQSWDLQVDGDWDWVGYAAALESALAPPYRCSRGESSLFCDRSLPGDVLRVRVERGSHGAVSAVWAELLGVPD